MSNNKNLFSFDYEIIQLANNDEQKTPSRFSVVYGEGGRIVHTKKDSYQIVGTKDFSLIGTSFQENGYNVKPFVHKSGEIIGLNIEIKKNALTAVGDKNYNAIITLPNNGGGTGYLSIHEVRLICTNGMTRSKSLGNQYSIRIPHNMNYHTSILLMRESLEAFVNLINRIEIFDNKLDSQKLSDTNDAKRLLNEWFWENEFPASQKGDWTVDDFRKALVVSPNEIKCIDRYNQLIDAFNNELTYNKQLGLTLSVYTVYATVANYLSRRIEKSQSIAQEEIQFQRVENKVAYFNAFAEL